MNGSSKHGNFFVPAEIQSFFFSKLCRLMIQFTKDETQPDWHGYLYTFLLFATALVQSLFLHQYFHRAFVVGMRVRTAVIAAVYNKVIVGLQLLLSGCWYCTYANLGLSLYKMERKWFMLVLIILLIFRLFVLATRLVVPAQWER